MGMHYDVTCRNLRVAREIIRSAINFFVNLAHWGVLEEK